MSDQTRPTSERVREALGSALHARDLIEGRRVLDLFAGTGAMAFELLSRGAREAVLVESDRRAVQALRASAEALGLDDRVVVVRGDGFQRLPEGVFDLVFLDPPYSNVGRLGEVLRGLAAGALGEDAAVVIEHLTREPPPPPDRETGLACVATYKYGDTSLTLLQRDSPTDPPTDSS